MLKGAKPIRVRWAPSPTGVPHIGGVRTALFNYLFAKNQGGDFVLRIEDTDQNRLVPESVQKIEESLKLLNLNWDDRFIQSERLAIYDKYLGQLKEKGLVYEDEGAWRFKVPTGKILKWQDGVHGFVEFKSDVIEDFVVMKSDKFPTYHFANVVDDHEMQISHVMRGDEWLPSTPKHLMLYEALGWEPPTFVHMPVILGPDHKKLSKRDGAKSTAEYIEEGFLPEALVNFMAFLGWAPKDERELFSLEDLVKEFSLNRINKNSPIFNIEKLNWFNGQWIRKLSDEELAIKIAQRFKQPVEKIKDVLPIVKERLNTLDDFENIAGFFFKDSAEFKVNEISISGDILEKLIETYEQIKKWDKSALQETTIALMEKEGIAKPKMYQSIGIAITGSKVTPPIFDTLEKLGRDETIARLKDASEKIK